MSFSFLLRNASYLVIIGCLVGCNLKTKRSSLDVEVKPTAPGKSSVIPGTASNTENIVVPTEVGETKKIGLILGPGGLRAYSHLGVLAELNKRKIPIHAIVGIETGALVAALYAQKGQAYDAEWQMLKLKDEDWFERGLLLSKSGPRSPASLLPFIKESFGSRKIDQSVIPFACPSKSLGSSQVLMIDQGPFQQNLLYCLGFPPLFTAYQGSVAGAGSIRDAVDFLKKQGANHIALVHLLAGKNTGNGSDYYDSVVWSLVTDAYGSLAGLVQTIIPVPAADIGLKDFDRRNELIRRGQKAGQLGADELEKALQIN